MSAIPKHSLFSYLVGQLHLALFTLALALLCLPTIALADDELSLKRLDEIEAIADRDNTQGLKLLQEFKAKLTKSDSDIVHLETLQILSRLYSDAGDKQADQAMLKEFFQLAKTSKNQEAKVLAEIVQASALIDAGKLDEGIAQLQQIQQNLTAHSSPKIRFQLAMTLGFFYNAGGKFDLALSQYLEALPQSDLLPRRRVQYHLFTVTAIAKLYWRMKDLEKGLKIINEALAFAPMESAPKTFIDLYRLRGMIYQESGRPAQAIASYEQALKISKQTKMLKMEMSTSNAMSDHYLRKKEYKKAESFARRSLHLAQLSGHQEYTQLSKVNLGFALCGQGKMSEGVAYVKEALNYFNAGNFRSYQESILGEFAEVYESAGMYKEAIATLKEQRKIADELFRSSRAQAVAALQEQFNADQRQKQIDLLAKENALKDADIKNKRLQQTMTLLVTLLILMAGGFSFALYRRAKKLNSQLKSANVQLEFHAVHDPLTGLHNRRSFIELMRSRTLLQKAERRDGNAGNPNCMILLDIDHFKHINDHWGHTAGDAVLTEVAARLTSVVRETDLVLRWGGEEFLIYSPKSHPVQIAKLVERLLNVIGQSPVSFGSSSIPLTISAGFISLPFAGIPESVCNWEKTLQIADMALYLCKEKGRNRAYGIVGINQAYEEVMPVLEQSLIAAVAEGMVELIEVLGPKQALQTS
jgi:diguanylate cyclase (GGDEF)-like protein